ncbi:MAG: hypothetical protein HYR56_26800 [Acidobacteria bacterium]|nr:hypothetical protein [Acidobacteriota bacterium]MBI3422322.1 hypothetical protein [Acidobacteriota bacterium]
MPYQVRLLSCCLSLLWVSVPVLSQTPQAVPPKAIPKSAAGPRRLAFAEAQKLLGEAREGDLEKLLRREQVTYTRTMLAGGQVLELFYPVVANQPGKAGSKARTTTVPGYGVLYDSLAAYNEDKRPRHALEGLIPDGNAFIAAVPQLVARLEKRLRTGRLDYSRASLRKLDSFVAAYRRNHLSSETDAGLFQELTAYYGETLRRALNAEWQVLNERVGKTPYVHAEPNLRYTPTGAVRSLVVKPWSSVFNALYDEAQQGGAVTRAFDADAAGK